DGSYRIAQLPPGDYTLSSGSGEPVSVNVSIGGTTTVNLAGAGAVDLATVQVIGSRVINRVDVRSTESATNIRREEIARMPVDQNLSSVALLAPGVVASGATFGGLTFGGSSVAENVVYINGLNVTDPYRRQGFSTVPFGFYEEFQVKTGGYSAEFGRSTGGVINAVTRSGGNEFHAGAEFTMEPRAWVSEREDHFHKDGSIDERDRTRRGVRRRREGSAVLLRDVRAARQQPQGHRHHRGLVHRQQQRLLGWQAGLADQRQPPAVAAGLLRRGRVGHPQLQVRLGHRHARRGTGGKLRRLRRRQLVADVHRQLHPELRRQGGVRGAQAQFDQGQPAGSLLQHPGSGQYLPRGLRRGDHAGGVCPARQRRQQQVRRARGRAPGLRVDPG